MSLAHPNAEQVARDYLGQDTIAAQCGYGKEGVVFKSTRGTAVKVHSTERAFWNEYWAYQRLAETQTLWIRGFRVPRLIQADVPRRVIEMGIVEPPFLLDFGSPSTDYEPDFSPEVWADWWSAVEDWFEDRFPEAEAVFYALCNNLNIWHLDLRPSNLRFASNLMG